MSSVSSDMVDSGSYAGKRTARTPEKSTFSQTCFLLSQYLKEKGSFSDLALGMASLEGNGMPGTLHQASATTMKLFPEYAGFSSAISKEEVPKKVNSISGNKPEHGGAQMTIFYDGRVIVFDDFPAEKAKEIMQLANNSKKNPNSVPPCVVQKAAESVNVNPCPSNVVSSLSSNRIPEQVQLQPSRQTTVSSDLPIARKVSLTRFLEKRKDRLTSAAPYQVNNSSTAPPSAVDGKPWLGFADQSQ